MTRITGVLSSEDIEQHDRSVLLFLAGLFASDRKIRGIYDFSQVEALAIPISKIDQRAQRPAVLEGSRVLVAAPGTPGFDFALRISEQMRAAGQREAALAATLEEAYRLLELDDPQFDRADASF